MLRWMLDAYKHKDCHKCAYFKRMLRGTMMNIDGIEKIFRFINARHYFNIALYVVLLLIGVVLILQVNYEQLFLLWVGMIVAENLASRLEKDRL